MQILPINYNTYNCNNRTQSFKAYSTKVCKDNGKLAYRTLSNFFRADIVWPKFIEFIVAKYKNVDKVNVVNHACSVGYEPYSFLLLLINAIGEENIKKFVPVIARDIDEDVIKYAKVGKLEATYSEYAMADHYGGRFALKNRYYNENIFPKFFKTSYLKKPKTYEDLEDGLENEYIISCKKNIKKYVDFRRSDIFEDKDLISKENTILLLRNVWRYFGEEGIDKLSDFLANNMKKSSLLVIGGFDLANHIDEILINKGFQDTLYYHDEHHIFEPPG